MTDQFEHGYALLIGVDENHLPKWALPDVTKDITALENVLTHPDRCAYPPEQVRTITGSDATRQGILDGLEWLQDQVSADNNATAIVYFTGHGLRKGSSYYLVPYDIRAGRIRSRSIKGEDFAVEIAALTPPRLLVILDCCHASGMGIKGEDVLPESFTAYAAPPSLLIDKGTGVKDGDALAQGHGRAGFSSSTGDQSSYMRPDGQMSIFTYHLIEALTGHAQPKEGATEVLVSDVMSYVTRAVPQTAAAAGKTQDPEHQFSGGYFAVALLLGGKGLSKGQPAPDPLEPLPETTGHVSYHAEVHGSGAIAQGPGAVAAGERGVAIGGNVQGGVIVTGNNNEVNE